MKSMMSVTLALLCLHPVVAIAEEKTVEGLAQRIEALERRMDLLGEKAPLSDLKVDVPTPDESGGGGEIILYVSEGGAIRVRDEVIGRDELAGKLRAVSSLLPDQPLRIRADGKVKYHVLTEVIDLCMKAGIWNISFATVRSGVGEASLSE